MATQHDDELLDEYEGDGDDADLDGEGIFEDDEDIFGDEGRVDHDNPVITREQEQAQVYHEVATDTDDDAPVVEKQKPGADGTGTAPPQGLSTGERRQLVARLDNKNRWFVANFVNGQQKTPWRTPSRAELVKLDRDGRFAKGGVQEVVLGDTPAQPAGIPWKKILLGGAAVAGVAGLGYYAWKRWKADEDTEVDEVEG